MAVEETKDIFSAKGFDIKPGTTIFNHVYPLVVSLQLVISTTTAVVNIGEGRYAFDKTPNDEFNGAISAFDIHNKRTIFPVTASANIDALRAFSKVETLFIYSSCI